MPASRKIDTRYLVQALRDAERKGMKDTADELALAIEFGGLPRPGYHLVRNIRFGNVVEERDGTPYNCSVASEAYHCS